MLINIFSDGCSVKKIEEARDPVKDEIHKNLVFDKI